MVGLLISMSVFVASTSLGGAHAQEQLQDSQVTGVVVAIDLEDDRSVSDLTDAFPVVVQRALLGSRGIYLLRPTEPDVAGDRKEAAKLAKDIAHFSGVRYAEPDYATGLADRRYHSWPEGVPDAAGADEDAWRDQSLSRTQQLARVHGLGTGKGTVVAVLDTGLDPAHPALVDHLLPGYDYVADDDDPAEERSHLDDNRNGVVDEAFGHGTFVAGMVTLVAPDTRILPFRVLDSDGSGSSFVVAEAILDAVAQQADVINISLGSSEKIESHLIDDVLKDARRHGVVVVAAAGNAASDSKQYPAQNKEVLSVTSVNDDSQTLSAFANWGGWVDVAAHAERVAGPVPGGGYAWWAGTSMAAPQVSGQLALIRSRANDLPLDRQLEAVTKSSHKLTGKTKLKNGVVDLLASLRLADKHDKG